MIYPNEAQIRDLLMRHRVNAMDGAELTSFGAMPRHGFVTVDAFYTLPGTRLRLALTCLVVPSHSSPVKTTWPYVMMDIRFLRMDATNYTRAHVGYDGMGEFIEEHQGVYVTCMDDERGTTSILTAYTDTWDILETVDMDGEPWPTPSLNAVKLNAQHDLELLRASSYVTYN